MKPHPCLWTVVLAALLVVPVAVAQTATISSPTSGSTLSGSSVTISWSISGDVIDCWLAMGTTQGQRDLYNSGSLGAATSCTAAGLPIDGRTVYARLFYRGSSGWKYVDCQYVAASTSSTTSSTVSMTGPTPGSTLSGSSTTFSWTISTDVLQTWLYVGTTAGQGDLCRTSAGTATSCAATGLPTDGRTLYVRLFYRRSSGWSYLDSQYVAASSTESPTATSTVSMTSPAPGSTLTGTSVTFSWDQSSDVLENSLTISSRLAGNTCFSSNSLGLATSCTASGLPSDGRLLGVRLGYRTTSGWAYKNYRYRATGSGLSILGTGQQVDEPTDDGNSNDNKNHRHHRHQHPEEALNANDNQNRRHHRPVYPEESLNTNDNLDCRHYRHQHPEEAQNANDNQNCRHQRHHYSGENTNSEQSYQRPPPPPPDRGQDSGSNQNYGHRRPQSSEKGQSSDCGQNNRRRPPPPPEEFQNANDNQNDRHHRHQYPEENTNSEQDYRQRPPPPPPEEAQNANDNQNRRHRRPPPPEEVQNTNSSQNYPWIPYGK